MLKLKSVKTQLIIYLAGLALWGAIKDRDGSFLVATVIAVISALTIESLILYLKTKVFRVTESSIISGLIVGYVLSSDEAWWKFVLASSLAILFKHLIRFRKKHIFNPAGFGIFVVLILLGASTQWKETYLWYILLPFGLYFVYKIRKVEIIIGYAVVFLALFGTQAVFQKVPLWRIPGYLSYFFIFVMVIEPLTSPIKPIGKFLFGAGVAAFIFVLTALGVRFDVELFSLLIMNITTPFLNNMQFRIGGKV